MTDVTDIIQGTMLGLSREITDDATVEVERYVCPTLQGFIEVSNLGEFDLLLRAGGFTHTIIHPGDTFRGKTAFRYFDIKIFDDLDPLDGDECEFVATVTEDEEILVNERHYFELATQLEDIDGDMILTSTNKTTSATTINAETVGEGGDGFYDVKYEVVLKDTSNITHTWFNGNFAIEVETDSEAGNVEVKGGYPVITLIEGEGEITIRYTGEFEQGDIITLTVIGGEKYGYPVDDLEITDTLS